LGEPDPVIVLERTVGPGGLFATDDEMVPVDANVHPGGELVALEQAAKLGLGGSHLLLHGAHLTSGSPW
jgi:hypothetical protein